MDKGIAFIALNVRNNSSKYIFKETNMENTTITPFNLIGIEIRTNTKGIVELATDMQNLWGKFIAQNIAGQIPNKIDNTVYAVYTDYEGDYTKPYTAFIGCKVAEVDSIPDSMVARSFHGGKYAKYIAKGNLLQGSVVNAWKHIWSLNLDRKYTADFEIYGEKAANYLDAEVEILVGIN